MSLFLQIGVPMLRRHHHLQRLAVFGELRVPDLKSSEEREAYRFFWSRSFHRAVLISVFVHDDAHGVLNVKVAAGTEDDGPGELVIDRDVQLGASEIQVLRDVVRSNRFWRERIRSELTADGSGWTIEIRQWKKYHFGSQISPKGGSIRNVGMHLIELSGLELAPEEIY
jgi:hypothetical protein